MTTLHILWLEFQILFYSELVHEIQNVETQNDTTYKVLYKNLIIFYVKEFLPDVYKYKLMLIITIPYVVILTLIAVVYYTIMFYKVRAYYHKFPENLI